jgi:hypothetical protein
MREKLQNHLKIRNYTIIFNPLKIKTNQEDERQQPFTA